MTLLSPMDIAPEEHRAALGLGAREGGTRYAVAECHAVAQRRNSPHMRRRYACEIKMRPEVLCVD